jgi:hypothetical protein
MFSLGAIASRLVVEALPASGIVAGMFQPKEPGRSSPAGVTERSGGRADATRSCLVGRATRRRRRPAPPARRRPGRSARRPEGGAQAHQGLHDRASASAGSRSPSPAASPSRAGLARPHQDQQPGNRGHPQRFPHSTSRTPSRRAAPRPAVRHEALGNWVVPTGATRSLLLAAEGPGGRHPPEPSRRRSEISARSLPSWARRPPTRGGGPDRRHGRLGAGCDAEAPAELPGHHPDSLSLLVTAERSRAMLQGVQVVIVDEIHDVAGNKRGSLLADARAADGPGPGTP